MFLLTEYKARVQVLACQLLADVVNLNQNVPRQNIVKANYCTRHYSYGMQNCRTMSSKKQS